jgi:hypothetical protein
MKLDRDSQEFYDCKEQFQTILKSFAEEFFIIQQAKLAQKTAQDYFLVADAWAEYLFGYTDCIDYKDISVAQTNSKFFESERHQGLYGFDSKEVRYKLKAFVDFLKKKGYSNPNVDKALMKK